MLAAAFPRKHQNAAIVAGERVIESLDQRYWWGQFESQVDGERVLIPVRLHFASCGPALSNSDESWLLSRALETRSTDGYRRQRAIGDLLQNPQSWTAPFVVSLIGGYVIEILDDISAALTPELEQSLGKFIGANKPLWETTKSRVTSYWDAYYRRRQSGGCGLVFSREAYVGFKIVDRLETAASSFAGKGSS